MASLDYPPGFGDEGVQGGGGTDWWEGNALDTEVAGPGVGNVNAGSDMGNGNNNGNNGNGPPPRPQNTNSPPSTTNPPAKTCSYESTISTNTITTSTATTSSASSASSTPSASSVPSTSSQSSASYISSISINTNTTSTVDTSSSFSSSFSTPAPTVTISTTSSNSSTLLAPTTSISSTSITISSSTITATPLSNTGAGTQPVGVTSLPIVASTQHGLSKGSIAGIAIGSLTLLALIPTAIWYFLRRKKNNKQHRKSIGGFGVVEWNGGGNGSNMAQVNESPSYNSKITHGMGVQRISTWNTMRSLPGTHTRASSSISQFPSAPSSLSPSTVQNPFSDQTHFSSFSFPFAPSQQPESPNQPTSNATTNEEGPHEDIVDFGDSIDWIRKRDRMRDRERSGLTGSNLGSGMGEGKPDWRYSVRVNGGGNNL